MYFNRHQAWIVGLASLLTLLGCKTLQRSLDDFGLTLVDIRVDNKALSTLNSTVTAKIPIPAVVKIDGREYDIKLKYAGKSSIDDFKKNKQLEMRRGQRFRGRSEYRLGSHGFDSSGLRIPLGFAVFRAIGLQVPEVEPAAAYLNRNYIGLYFLIEPIDKEFFDVRRIAIGPAFKSTYGQGDFTPETLGHLTTAFSIEEGPESYAPLVHLMTQVADKNSPANLKELERLVDVQQYLRYIAGAVYLNHFDGFRNNFVLYRDESVGKFRIVPWDLDRIYEKEKGTYHDGVSIWGDNALTAKLLSYPELKQQYLGFLEELFTKMAPATLEELIRENARKISKAFASDRVLSANGNTAEKKADELSQAMHKWLEALKADLKTQQAAVKKD